MGSHSADKIKFTSFDDLFGAKPEAGVDESQIVRIPLSKLHPFHHHPFRVLDDEKMMETVRSVKQYGVLLPGLVRQDQNGGYEIVAGHRRKRASELAGCDDMPVIIRNLSDDEATVIMVDSNIQREDLLPSEKAWAYRMKLEALSHQGAKGEKYTADVIGETAGESGRTVQRYIRLTYLKEELLDYIDQKKLQMMAGERISFLTGEEQGWVLRVIEEHCRFPSKNEAEILKEESSQSTLTEKILLELLLRVEKPKGITISGKRIREYFPQNYTREQIETILYELLDSWKSNLDQEETES